MKSMPMSDAADQLPNEPEPGEASEPTAGALTVEVDAADYPTLADAQEGDTFVLSGTATVKANADGKLTLDISDADFEANESGEKGAGFDAGSGTGLLGGGATE